MYRVDEFPGLYIDGHMVRVLGEVEEAETEDEKRAFQVRADAYWDAYHSEGADPICTLQPSPPPNRLGINVGPFG